VAKILDNCSLALIAFGSNENSILGYPRETVQKAMKFVADMSVKPHNSSGLYTNPAFPKGAGPEFVNAAMAIHTNLSPAELLDELHQIEARALRTRSKRWGQRTLDLDLIGVGELVQPDYTTFARWRDLGLSEQQVETPTELILPHPRMQDRAFVLVPLCDVAPDWRHPVSGKTVREMRDALPSNDLAEVVRLSD